MECDQDHGYENLRTNIANEKRTAYIFYLKFLVFLDPGRWTCQCLDYDIAAQGSSILNAVDNCWRTILGQVVVDLHKADRSPLGRFSPPDPLYSEQFTTAHTLHINESYNVDSELGDVHIRIHLQDVKIFA